ncbi:molybdopterin molybdotransferase MoeA [Rhizomicrobium electricum]|uniref:Molybdopterin molybdenumtransferase n=1 Tax=Rhizomicrobium electricum TaxID=480070 RepID=A0ABN1ES58_9PROT|nr:molybdopterin molybdotransferase MoeA [Rhizomicrobium electricum]NIJ49046.1 molybdopterin molybdotransferase [Rhizomicrobium electricum]
MISFDESLRQVAELAKPLPAEMVPLAEADGRVLAAPVVAGRNAPAFAVSAMDGYAVRDEDLRNLPATLRVTGKSFAGGGVPDAILPGTCVRVFTGAAVPPGADRVIIQEDVTATNDGAQFDHPPGSSRHIRAAGSDFAIGDVLVPADVPLNPQRLVAAAAADLADVAVIRQPRVFILANGDELRAPGSAGAADQIPDSLTTALTAFVRRWHGNVAGHSVCPDDLSRLQRTASEAVSQADVVVVTGGASVGERDFAKTMFADHDLHLVFAKVAIRPGKPVWLGRAGSTLIVGLPGNPTSALVTARLYLAPLLAGLAGFDPATAWAWQTRPLAAPLETGGERHTFLRAKSSGDGVEALRDQDSGAQKALAAAEYLISRPPSAARAETGSLVDTLLI